MEQTKENKMGTMPVNKLLVTMSLPMVISMIVQALYNIVDSIFVSRLSEDALTAVSMAFPMQNLMISVAVGTGVGINAMLSRALGEKKFEAANKTAENGIFIEVLGYVLFLLIGIFVTKPFFLHKRVQAILQIWVLNIQEFVCLCHLVFLCRLVLKESFNPQDEQYSQ